MNQPPNVFNEKLYSYLEIIAREGIQNAAKGFSGMLGRNLQVTQPSVQLININEISSVMGGPENEAVGIYLRGEGSVASQIMLIMPYAEAMEMADLLLDQPPGTTTQLGKLERSALAEVGNITGTFFLNSVASITGLELRPTPPAVMVDMVGSILDIVVATTGGLTEHVLSLHTNFVIGDRAAEASFWVIPDQATLDSFSGQL